MMASEDDYCPSAMCSILPVGFMLLVSDLLYDLRWCVSPSEQNARQLKDYYMTILTPRLLPLPWPGFLFPFYVIYVFVGVCPNWTGLSLFFLYIPICEKYYRIKRDEKNCLRGWWWIVAIRLLMGIVTYIGIVERGCQLTDYKDNVRGFILYSLSNSGGMTIEK